MKITEKLLKFKYHIIIFIVFSLIIFSLYILAPKFVTVLAYFWPLFLSTALFLIAVVVFGSTISSHLTDDTSGEGILDYVAGQPPELLSDGKSGAVLSDYVDAAPPEHAD